MGVEGDEGKYENYEDDSFYLELERQIIQLIDNSEEVKPRKNVSSVSQNPQVITGKTRLLQRRNYYDWSVCGRSTAPAVYSYSPAASGTGVFIPQAANSGTQYYKKLN